MLFTLPSQGRVKSIKASLLLGERFGERSKCIASKREALYFVNSEPEFIHYLPVSSKESQFINEQTIVANRLQCDRNPAQQELADWIRFSSKDAEKYRDGLTTASMEIEGFSGWVVRNFYSKDNVMKKDFRKKGLDKIKQEVLKYSNIVLKYSNIVLKYPNIVLKYPNIVLKYPNIVLKYLNIVLKYPNIVLKYPNIVLKYPNIVLKYPNIVLKYSNIVLKYLNIS
ncbi:hypothetical protein [Nostoc sp.]|uniref:hypothetical protein n=1 Tax=Nostoc sp. TaxID=1180 RepID=UPI002FFB2DE4